ncbi:unnamed protein product [Larinioides sclopetarius]|uniref:Uncharacterized protein n=1 Tax=Larinioides sclopetarius TaxID=280406 RepID=A0AAV1ZZV0_9ARAC
MTTTFSLIGSTTGRGLSFFTPIFAISTNLGASTLTGSFTMGTDLTSAFGVTFLRFGSTTGFDGISLGLGVISLSFNGISLSLVGTSLGLDGASLGLDGASLGLDGTS